MLKKPLGFNFGPLEVSFETYSSLGLIIGFQTTFTLTSLNDELIEEGIARELISKIQNMRKESGFEITDRIIVSYKGDELVTKTINNCDKLIKDETLAIDMKETELNNEAIDINGHETYLNVEKSN